MNKKKTASPASEADTTNTDILPQPNLNVTSQSFLESRGYVGGIGQYYTNEFDPDNPEKKLKPYITIGDDGIRSLVDTPQEEDKDFAQWAIFSTFMSRNHRKQLEQGLFWYLWADIDKSPPPLDVVEAVIIKIIGDANDYEIYTSKSATQDCQKCRILIPLTKVLPGKKWVLCQQILNDKLEALDVTPDRVNERPGQICYLPNRGVFYDSRSKRNV